MVPCFRVYETFEVFRANVRRIRDDVEPETAAEDPDKHHASRGAIDTPDPATVSCVYLAAGWLELRKFLGSA